ncbi:MAG: chemotaxis-specific protein-glutamate methyltransferase CheB [Candidatus Thermoplasmatota archaeon]
MPSQKIRVVIVDDSNFMVTILKDILGNEDSIEVVGTGRDGEDAIELNKEKNPDVILLDVQMAEMDGLTALERIMEEDPNPIVIISGMGDKAGKMSVKALDAGAVDFISKTSGPLSMDIRKKSDEIIEKVVNAAKTDIESFERESKKLAKEKFVPEVSSDRLIVVASSTGGTRALDNFLSIFPSNFPVPIIVVQHMPQSFTTYLASTLNSKLDLPVKEAKDHDEVKNNQVYIIPSGYHGMISTWKGKTFISLNDEPKLHGVKPSADYLFRSASEKFRGRLVGIVLTGMGEDGASGAEAIKSNDGFLAIQDKDSSVVHGMPDTAKKRAGCDFEGAPSEIGKKMVEMFMEEN